MKRTIGVVACMVLVTGCGVFGTSADEPSPGGSEAAPPSPPARANEPPPPPSLSGTPTESDLVESFGVFVTEKGSDDGDGTRARPFGSITKGIATAKPSGKRVYVCEGKFSEAITIEDGIAIVGGLDCSRDRNGRSARADRASSRRRALRCARRT